MRICADPDTKHCVFRFKIKLLKFGVLMADFAKPLAVILVRFGELQFSQRVNGLLRVLMIIQLNSGDLMVNFYKH